VEYGLTRVLSHVSKGVFVILGSEGFRFTCRELDPLTLALGELVFKSCAQRADVWTTPEKWVCS
jgi:hypothetical protein